jgi:hypothetical protein
VQVLSGHLKKGNITYVKSVRRDSWSSEEPFQAGIVSMQMVVFTTLQNDAAPRIRPSECSCWLSRMTRES